MTSELTALPYAAWHAQTARQVAEYLRGDPAQGLTPEEAQVRRRRFGPNRLTPPRRKPAIVRFLEQFRNPLRLCCSPPAW